MTTMHYERREDGYYAVWSADFDSDDPGERKIVDERELSSAIAYSNDVRIKNCLTCETGRKWWLRIEEALECLVCQGDPLVESSGRKDWRDFSRAKMIQMHGVRLEGDEELFEKYREELEKK